MFSKLPRAIILFLILLSLNLTYAEVTLDIYTGMSFYRLSEMLIEQDGYETVKIDGVRYRPDPWTDFPNVTGNYYGIRLGYFFETLPSIGLELEQLHSKAYYDSGIDPEGVVQHFEVTDGMNFIMLNGVYRISDEISETYPKGSEQLLLRVGVGPTISKPASTIRGQNNGYEYTGTLKGYGLAGVGGQVSVQVKMFMFPWLAYSLEYKLTSTLATVAIANGSVTTPLNAGHMVFGFSFSF